MPTLVKGRRDWPAVLSLGFNIDRNGKRRKPAWINIVVLGILLPGFAVWGLYRAFTTPTGIGLWGLTAAMYLFTLFGVTLGNHRYWTHRGFEARFPLQVVLAVASGMSMEGDIQRWVLNHRAHHRFADMAGKDPHSPYEYPGWRGFKGLVWAQGVWLFFTYDRPPGYAMHRDLAGDRLVQWQRRAFPFLAAANFLVPLAFFPLYGWNSVLIAGALRTAALMTATGFVNSVCHKWGSRAKDSRGHEYRADDSRNNVFVAIMTGGEGNHSWHHADPACPRHAQEHGICSSSVRPGLTLPDFFDADVSGRDFTHGKPHPEMFLTAAHELGAAPETAIVMEDAAAGIEAAKAGGMAAIGIARAHDADLLSAAGADIVVTTLDEVDLAALADGQLATKR